jgi:hypothetical protein
MSTKEQTLINRCRLFLQVECISDISDSDGRHIAKSWLYKDGRKNSASTKRWPKQSDPGEQAWRIWRNFLIKSLTAETLQLRRPLGAWTHLNQHRQYESYWDEAHLRLLQRKKDHWTAHNLVKEDRRRYFFIRQESIVSEHPQNLIPLDILDKNERFYITRKPAKLTKPQIKNHRFPKISEDDTIEFLREEKEFPSLLAKTRLIDAASDGSHDPATGKMAFGWVLAIGEQIVATGKGSAAGHPNLSSAFRAEAYGLWSVAKFLNALSEQYQIADSNHKLFLHIDNKALISRMERYNDSGIHTKSTHFPDSDVTISAHRDLQQWSAQFQHVKGHSTTQTPEINFPTRLNSIADELARDQLGTMKQPKQEVNSHFCLLRINDMYITRDIQKIVMNAASKAPIQYFLCEKYEWNSSTFDLINWDLQAKILSTYDKNDQQRILKFVHEWLPTNHRLRRESQSTTARCPLCFFRVEDNIHLFQCSHPIQMATKQDLLQKLNLAKLEEPLKPIIVAALKSAILDPGWKPPGSLITEELTRGVKDQNRIGWQQVLRGRFAQTLTNGDKKKNQELRQLLRHIWDALLQLWKQRNESVHRNKSETRNERNKRRMEAKITRCYQHKDKLRIQDRVKIFTKEQDELLQEDSVLIKNWLRIAEKAIRISKQEARAVQREKSMMEQYFKWHPPDRMGRHTRNSMGSGSTIHVG